MLTKSQGHHLCFGHVSNIATKKKKRHKSSTNRKRRPPSQCTGPRRHLLLQIFLNPEPPQVLKIKKGRLPHRSPPHSLAGHPPSLRGPPALARDSFTRERGRGWGWGWGEGPACPKVTTGVFFLESLLLSLRSRLATRRHRLARLRTPIERSHLIAP